MRKLKAEVLVFNFPQHTQIEKPSDLLTFSDLYKKEIVEVKKYLKLRESRWASLFFTRVLPNGQLEELKEHGGVPKNIKEDGFDFVNGFNLSLNMQTEEATINHIRFDNILGILPGLGTTPVNQIFEFQKNEIVQEYLLFLEQFKESMKELMEKNHHVKIFLSSNMVIEAEVLEINKSNLLIKNLRSRLDELDDKGHYVHVDTRPIKKTLYFIEIENFIHKIEIYPWKLKISPFDDDL